MASITPKAITVVSHVMAATLNDASPKLPAITDNTAAKAVATMNQRLTYSSLVTSLRMTMLIVRSPPGDA